MSNPRLQSPEPSILRTPFCVLSVDQVDTGDSDVTDESNKRRQVSGLIAELSSREVTLKVVIGFQRPSFLADGLASDWCWAHELDKSESQPEVTTVFKGTRAQFKMFAPMFAAWVDAQDADASR